MDSSYRALLGRAAARDMVAALGAAWLSFGMLPLALFLAAHRATGSSGSAGLAVGAFSAGAGLLAPVRGRLIDRHGVRRRLPGFAAGYALALIAFSVLAALRAPIWALVACAAAAGASAPPLVATLRMLWARVVEPPLLRRAYALTSLVGDVGLVAAPAGAALLFAAASWSPLVVCTAAAVVATGIAVRSAQPPSSHLTGDRIAAPAPARGGMRPLLAVSVALGASLGLVEVAVPSAAARWHAVTASGPLLGAFALGSVAGGLWFGRRAWRRPPEERYLIAVLALALALAPPLVATGPWELGPLLAVAGLAYGPATISLFEALDSLAPTGGAEALTWVTTAEAIGGAAGAAVSGWATTRLGTWAPFTAASIVLTAASAAALVRGTGFTAAARTRRLR